MANPRRGGRDKKRVKKNIATGIAHIRSTFNNTVITITDVQGNGTTTASRAFAAPSKSVEYCTTEACAVSEGGAQRCCEGRGL